MGESLVPRNLPTRFLLFSPTFQGKSPHLITVIRLSVRLSVCAFALLVLFSSKLGRRICVSITFTYGERRPPSVRVLVWVVRGYGLWVRGQGSGVMGYGLWVMGYGPF